MRQQKITTVMLDGNRGATRRKTHDWQAQHGNGILNIRRGGLGNINVRFLPNGVVKPSILSLDLELAKRYLAALVKAVFPVAADKTWNLGIVVGRNAIVVEIVKQGEKPAADARAA